MVLEIHFKEGTKVLINKDLLLRKHKQTTQKPNLTTVLYIYIIRYNTYYIIGENILEPRLRSHQKSSSKPPEQHI